MQTVGAATVTLGNIRVIVNALGTVTPLATATATPQVGGLLMKLYFTEGQMVKAGDLLIVVESMKMEFAVVAPSDGILSELRCTEGRAVALGQTLAVMMKDAG